MSSRGHDFVRPFIMTGGRTTVEHIELRFETLVRRLPGVTVPGAMPTEKVAVLDQCRQLCSVAEIAAELDLVVGVVQVLIEDLVTTDFVEVFTSDLQDDAELHLDMLTRITEKIRSL